MFLKSQDHRQGNRHHRFSISAAAWGATHDLARRHPRYSVSIRAPRFREGRCIRDNWCDEYTKFQSAPPAFARGDPDCGLMRQMLITFQSAPPAFARGDAEIPDHAPAELEFQSAPPAFARGDRLSYKCMTLGVMFQSAPPAFARGDANFTRISYK